MCLKRRGVALQRRMMTNATGIIGTIFQRLYSKLKCTHISSLSLTTKIYKVVYYDNERKTLLFVIFDRCRLDLSTHSILRYFGSRHPNDAKKDDDRNVLCAELFVDILNDCSACRHHILFPSTGCSKIRREPPLP
jgi:hypothetical protein